jgi:hypothetical protein
MYAYWALGKTVIGWMRTRLGLGFVYLCGELRVGGRALDLRQLCGLMKSEIRRWPAAALLAAYMRRVFASAHPPLTSRAGQCACVRRHTC